METVTVDLLQQFSDALTKIETLSNGRFSRKSLGENTTKLTTLLTDFERASNLLETKEASRGNAIAASLTKIEIPTRYWSANYREVDQGLVNSFETALLQDASSSAYIYGMPGVGKTHLVSAWVVHELWNLKPTMVFSDEISPIWKAPTYSFPVITPTSPVQSALFVSAPSLLYRIKRTYNDNSSETEFSILDPIFNTPILIMDDLGTEKMSDWVEQILFQIFNTRYSNQLQTIITSNLDPNQLEFKFKSKLAGRILEMCGLVHAVGKDRRNLNVILKGGCV